MLEKLNWKLNKKPYSKRLVYLSIVVPWFALGMLFIIGAILLASGFHVVGGILLLAIILLGILWFRIDSKAGYLDSIHSTYLEWRKKLEDKYGE